MTEEHRPSRAGRQTGKAAESSLRVILTWTIVSLCLQMLYDYRSSRAGVHSNLGSALFRGRAAEDLEGAEPRVMWKIPATRGQKTKNVKQGY